MANSQEAEKPIIVRAISLVIVSINHYQKQSDHTHSISNKIISG